MPPLVLSGTEASATDHCAATRMHVQNVEAPIKEQSAQEKPKDLGTCKLVYNVNIMWLV